MDCENAEKLFARMIFGELEAEQEAELSEHLAGCPACSETLAGMRRSVYLVREGLEAQTPVLSPERRKAVLGETEKPQRIAPGKVKKPPLTRRDQIRLAPKTDRLPLFTGIGAAAAGIIFVLIIGGMFVPSLSRSREEARKASERIAMIGGEYDEQSVVAPEQGKEGEHWSAKAKLQQRQRSYTGPPRGPGGGDYDRPRTKRPAEAPSRSPMKPSMVTPARDDSRGKVLASADTGTEWKEVGVRSAKLRDIVKKVPLTTEVADFEDSFEVNGKTELSETAKGFETAIGGADGVRRKAVMKGGGKKANLGVDADRAVKEAYVRVDKPQTGRVETAASEPQAVYKKVTEEKKIGDDKAYYLALPKDTGSKATLDYDPLSFAKKRESESLRAEQAAERRMPKSDEKDRLAKRELAQREELEEEQSDGIPERAAFKMVPVNPFVMTKKDELSTFAIDVDVASYTRTRSYIRKGYLPPAASVRMEEFINAFDYNYPRQTDKTFAVHAEAAPSVFGRALTLIKIGIKGRVLGREGRKPAHLVFVVDASGSMARQDRMPLIKYGLTALVGKLEPRDRVSLVVYGTQSRLVLEAVPADKREQIATAVRSVQCGGSTNMVEGLALGYSMAGRHFRAGEINRVILCSDGVANIGATDAEQMLKRVETFRNYGITFSSIGFGMGVYNDALLEKLANSGDGTYSFCDSREEARRIFVEKMSAEIQTIAKDVKIQVEFNARRIRRYRLIGYENRDIADDRFRDDTVDAGEVGSGQSATALYEVELLGAKFKGELPEHLGKVYVRYRNADTGEIEEISHRLENNIVRYRSPEKAPRYFLAACAAEFAEILRMSEHAKNGNLVEVQRLLEKVAVKLPLDQKVRELLWMVKQAQGLPRA